VVLFHAVTAAIDGDHLSVVQEPVQQGRGQHLVSQQVSPVGKARIGGQNDRTMLVARRDQLKEVVSLLLRQLGVADFVDEKPGWEQYSVGGAGA
jgi:hypothetical protein